MLREYTSYVQLPSESEFETGLEPDWHPIVQSRVRTTSAHPTGQLRSRDIARALYPTFPLKVEWRQLPQPGDAAAGPPPSTGLPGPPGPPGPAGPPGPPGGGGTGIVYPFTLADDAQLTIPIPSIPAGGLIRLETYSTSSSFFGWQADLLLSPTAIAIELGIVQHTTLQPSSTITALADPDGSLNLALDIPGQLTFRNRLGQSITGLIKLTDLPSIGTSPPGATARQWQSALASRGVIYSVLDTIPASANDPVHIQWFAAGNILPPPSPDPLWAFTKSALGFTDAAMLDLYNLALTQAP